MPENISMTENSEATLVYVTIGVAASAAALGSQLQYLPAQIQPVAAVLTTVLSVVAGVLTAFWKIKVNNTKTEA